MHNTQSPDLHIFCKQGDLYQVKRLVSTQNLNQVDVHGNTPLYYACLCGHFAVVRYLSDLGARDDPFGRCYWNALSLGIRKLLKLYNKYQTIQDEVKDHVERKEDGIFVCLEAMLRRVLLETTRNQDSDLTLRVKFSDQPEVTEYYCHRWILLARWPLLLELVLNKERPIPIQSSAVICAGILLNHQDILSLKTNKEFEAYFFNNHPTVVTWSEVRSHIRNYKKIIEEFNTHKKLLDDKPLDSRIEKINQSLPDNESELKKFLNENVQCIDLGELPFRKFSFETILDYIYTAKVPLFTDPLLVQEIMKLFETLGIPMSDLTNFANLSVTNMLKHERELLDQLESCYFLESEAPASRIDHLRKLCCNFKLCKYVDDAEIPDTPSDGILCDKSFLIKRSEFFNVMLNSQFEEGEHVREMESRHEVPCLELHQCSNLLDLVRYIYTERSDISPSNVYELLSYSEKMEFYNLRAKCEDFINEMPIEDEQLLDVMRMAITFDLKKKKLAITRPLWHYLGVQLKCEKMTLEEVENTLLSLGYEEMDVVDIVLKIGQGL